MDLNICDIDYMNFEDPEILVDFLIDKLKSEKHDEYESVKLYGNDELMFDILTILLKSDKYNYIRIGCIELSLKWFDRNERSEYVFEISENNVASIQVAWGDNSPLLNESKFTICMNYCSQEIFDNVVSDGTPLIIANISTKK